MCVVNIMQSSSFPKSHAQGRLSAQRERVRLGVEREGEGGMVKWRAGGRGRKG